MKTRLLVTLVAVGLFASPGWSDEATVPTPRKKLTVIVLEGTPYQRGLKHGRELKQAIHELLQLWKRHIKSAYGLDADAFVKKFLARTDYVSAIKKWTPDLLDEIHGLADGSGTDFDTMLVFQFVDEYWVQGEAIAREHCSSLGVPARQGRPTIVAQNLDVEGFLDGFQTILHIKDAARGLESLVLTNAGFIGANGMNNHQVGLCVNTVSQLAPCRDGLPVACVVRGVLAQRSAAEAVAFLRGIKHASGQNYVVGGPSGVWDLECSAHQATPYQPGTPAGLVWHTNHPLANDDYTTAYRDFLAKKNVERAAISTYVRLETLNARLRSETQIDSDGIKALLSSAGSGPFPVCRPLKGRDDVFTFASTVMVLGPNPELWIAPGPPNVTPYQRLVLPLAK